MATPPDDVLDRALGYPYERPTGSFLFEPSSGAVTMLDEADATVARKGRTVVLAVGSNAAPAQLRRKFGDTTEAGEVIPVVAATLLDHDVVYAAMVAGYGSIPATTIASPGTRCSIHATLLTDAQLARMNETEGVGRAYDLVEVEPTDVDLGTPLGGPVLAYLARPGALRVDGAPVALAAIAAEGRCFAAWTEEQVLTHVAAASGLGVEAFVASMVGDDDARIAMNAALTR